MAQDMGDRLSSGHGYALMGRVGVEVAHGLGGRPGMQ